MEKMVGKSLQRIFDDITASHAKTASRNYFENELHIQFSETLKILKKKVMGNYHSTGSNNYTKSKQA